MTIATLFLVLSPAAIAMLVLDQRSTLAPGGWLKQAAFTSALAALALWVTVLAARPVLDALNVSGSTFRIVAGILVIFSALQAFLALNLRHHEATQNWNIVALVLWLVSPAALAVAIVIRINDGIATGLAVSAFGVLVTVLAGFLWVEYFGAKRTLLLGWIRRFMAAAAALGGVDLIRQGVLSI